MMNDIITIYIWALRNDQGGIHVYNYEDFGARQLFLHRIGAKMIPTEMSALVDVKVKIRNVGAPIYAYSKPPL